MTRARKFLGPQITSMNWAPSRIRKSDNLQLVEPRNFRVLNRGVNLKLRSSDKWLQRWKAEISSRWSLKNRNLKSTSLVFLPRKNQNIHHPPSIVWQDRVLSVKSLQVIYPRPARRESGKHLSLIIRAMAYLLLSISWPKITLIKRFHKRINNLKLKLIRIMMGFRKPVRAKIVKILRTLWSKSI